MKRKILPLTISNLMIASSVTFAAANPFSDVPAGHWAYDAVTQLASEGVVDGYGDGTYLGNRNITRYEMAQMVARAMAKVQSGVKVTSTGDANLKSLMAEFKNELDNLGIRVNELEKYVDKVKWHGKLEYEYLHTRVDGQLKDGTSFNKLKMKLYPEAEINDHWSAKAKITAYTNYNSKSNTTDNDENKFKLERAFAEGNYKNFTVQFGRVPILSENDNYMIMDSEASGGQVIIGSKYKLKMFAGKWKGLPYEFAEFYNDAKSKFDFGIGFHRMKKNSYRTMVTETNGYYNSVYANIFSGGLSYRFDKNFALSGSFAQNSLSHTYASTQRRAYSAEIDFKNADKENPSSWGLFAAYRKLGHMAVIEPTYDISIIGVKGFHFGGEYVFAKNFSGQIQYFIGERVSPRYQGRHTNKIYTKLEWDF